MKTFLAWVGGTALAVLALLALSGALLPTLAVLVLNLLPLLRP
jgi:hypothetical protein